MYESKSSSKHSGDLSMGFNRVFTSKKTIQAIPLLKFIQKIFRTLLSTKNCYIWVRLKITNGNKWSL